MEQYIQHPITQSESTHEDIDKCKSTSSGTTVLENNPSGGFDCNICLDLVQDPVVTFCGHLYCWPCIYRWIHSQRASFLDSEDLPDHQEPQCPVCKTDVTLNTLIPLFGRGPQSGKSAHGNKGTQVGPVIPQRPNGPGCGVHTLITATTSTSSHPRQQQRHRVYPHQQVHPYYSTSPEFGFAGTTTFHPMIGMFGEMIFARIFGNSETTLYTYPNTYNVATTSSARARRHVMQVDRSLSRVSFFLCCCLILCLLLF